MCPALGLWGVLVPLWWLAVVYLARNSELSIYICVNNDEAFAGGRVSG